MNFLHGTDERKDLLGKSDYKTAEETEEALRTLARIMALDGHTYLHNTPTQDNNANRPDTGENECGQVVHNGQGIVGCGCKSLRGKQA
jgi:hypothetical protein